MPRMLLLAAVLLPLTACGAAGSLDPDASMAGVDAARAGPNVVIDSASASEQGVDPNHDSCIWPGCRYDVAIKMTNKGTATASFTVKYICRTRLGNHTINDPTVHELAPGYQGNLTTRLTTEQRCGVGVDGVLHYLGHDAGSMPEDLTFKIRGP